MTAVLDRETLTGVDEPTSAELKAAASAYKEAPANLKAAIIAAGLKGDRPADIVRAIGHVYTYDYVARLVRKARKDASVS